MPLPPIYRTLIKTHHMTSHSKIQKLTAAASKNHVSVILKTGTSPGIMLVEGDGDGDGGVAGWVSFIRKLRYKDFHVIKKDTIEVLNEEKMGLERLGIERGTVRGFAEMSNFGKFLEGDEGLFRWWRVGMGWVRDEDGGEGKGKV